MRTLRRTIPLLITAALLSGCSGAAAPASNITASSAKLNAQGSCTSSCAWYFRYHATGTTRWSVTPIRTVTGTFKNTALTETASSLKAGEDYEYEVCGKGDQVTSFVCVGLPSRKRASFTVPGAANSTIEKQVVDEVNRYRSNAGVPPVRVDATLNQAAETTPDYLTGANSYMDPCYDGFQSVTAYEGPVSAAQLVQQVADSIEGGQCRLLHPRTSRIGIASSTLRDGTRRWVLYLASEMVAVA